MTLKRAMESSQNSDSSPTKFIKAKSKVRKLRSVVKKQVLKNEANRKKIKRKDKKISSLQAMLNTLQDKNFLSKTEFDNLNDIIGSQKCTDLLTRIILKSKNNKVMKTYPVELKKFALTLYFYSPKAYDYVRNKMKNCLPHPRTVCEWFKANNCEPGYTAESFELLSQVSLNSTQNGKKVIGNLVMDEMSIKKGIEWGRDFQAEGYVYDFGMGANQNIEAREILVFILVGVNQSWKIPLAYFPVNGCSAEQKKIL